MDTNTTTATAALISCARPECGIDLPCEACTAAWLDANRPDALESLLWNGYGSARSIAAEAADAYTPDATNYDDAGERTSSSSSTRGNTVNGRPATDKQLGLIARLAGQLGVTIPTTGLNTREASELIDGLMAQAKRTPAAQADDTFRWRKIDDAWRVVGPAGALGTDIVITKADGEKVPARVTGETAPGVYTVEKLVTVGAAPAAPAARVEAQEGVAYKLTDGRIIRVAKGRESGNLYGLVWDGDWSFEPGLLRNIDRPLTVEEAKEFGQLNTRCCCCGRKLTKKSSIEAGIGPICEGRQDG